MKFIRNLFLAVIILASFAFSFFILFANPCRSPIGYKIGAFDDRFNVSEASLLDAAKEAEAIWENAVGKQLFVYDPQSSLPINLVYDDRQETADRNKTLEAKIDQTESSAKSVRAQFESLKSRFESAKADYEAMIENYQGLQKAYNDSVAYWNGQGGAPKEEYTKLEAQKGELKKLQGLIEQRRLEVNFFAQDVNDLVAKYNYLVKETNSNIEVINESADKEFEQGEYLMNRGKESINIYEFTERTQLVRILAHEFGHALGMGHNGNPESIMYSLNEGEGLLPSLEDISELKGICRIDR